jgi:hypothetical protein
MTMNFENCDRRFGVEMEFNAFDGLSRSKTLNDLPDGIYDVGQQIKTILNKNVEITKWQYTNNNKNWHIKPDSSCGMEICSPPDRGQRGIDNLKKVVDGLASVSKLSSDHRCSFHVHVEIADFSEKQIVYMITRWINFELFFYFLTNPLRWLNQYCIPLGFSSEFSTDTSYHFPSLLQKLSDTKYHSINLYHYAKNKKKTIEFRVMGSEGCRNSEDAINWCKLLLCFVERCKSHEGISEARLFYDELPNAVRFLNLVEFCKKDNEIIQWLISKLSAVIDLGSLFIYDAQKSFWCEIFSNSQEDIKNTIEKLENCLG